jgi:hypothetical protein
VLAELVRLDRARHRPIAGDSELTEAIKLVARAHQTLIWDRHRQLLRLRGALGEFFPVALDAFQDLAAPDTLELLGAAPDLGTAANLSRARIRGALTRARRRNSAERQVQATLGAEQLRPAPAGCGSAQRPGAECPETTASLTPCTSRPFCALTASPGACASYDTSAPAGSVTMPLSDPGYRLSQVAAGSSA